MKEKVKYKCKVFLLLFSIATVFFTESIHAASKVNPPILILGTPKHFGDYAAEILKAEGFNEFQIDSSRNVEFSLKYLKQFDIVILTEVSLTDQQKNILASYVKSGGNLIAFRPGKNIATIFGVKDKEDTLTKAYIAIDTLSSIGKGLITETLQLHATADLYRIWLH